jgi:CysZ protein
MSFQTEFSRGIKAYSEAHTVIFRYKLTNYLIIPAIVTVIYSALFFWLAASIAGNISTEADSYPWWLSWMGDGIKWFMRTIYWVAVAAFFFISIKYVVQVVLAPILSNLSVAVEKKVLGLEVPEITWKEAIQDMGRSLLLAIRNSIYEFFSCLLLGLLPGVGQIASIAVSSYFYGFGYMDYVMERKRMTIPQAVAFCRAHKGLAIGLGVVMYFLMLIPIIGWAFAPTYATVAATLETLRILKETNTGQQGDVFSGAVSNSATAR